METEKKANMEDLLNSALANLERGMERNNVLSGTQFFARCFVALHQAVNLVKKKDAPKKAKKAKKATPKKAGGK